MFCFCDLFDVFVVVLLGVGELVELIEIYMLWVLLMLWYVFKFKKLVCIVWFDFIGFESCECNVCQELVLNWCLVFEVYLCLLVLCSGLVGFVLVDDVYVVVDGCMLDWVLQMCCLFVVCMFDRLFVMGQVCIDDIDCFCNVLVVFYCVVLSSMLGGDVYLVCFSVEWVVYVEVLLWLCFVLQLVFVVLQVFDVVFVCFVLLLCECVVWGCFVDGYGDLCFEYVCLFDLLVVIDVLEFSIVLCQVDFFDELVFLGMECVLVGGVWVGLWLFVCVMCELDDLLLFVLFVFYIGVCVLLCVWLCVVYLFDGCLCMLVVWLLCVWVYLVVVQYVFDEVFSVMFVGCV